MEDKWVMLYRTFQGERLSLLGFGTMRLPTLPSGEVDEQTTRDMVKLYHRQRRGLLYLGNL